MILRTTPHPPRIVRHGAGGGGRVALTFDDGPSWQTKELADILRAGGARATFFVVGKHIPGREEILRDLVSGGHELGNHSFSHRQIYGKPLLTVYQIVRTGHLVRAAVGSTPRLLRPPRGHADAWVLRAARLAGKTVVGWSLDPRDWEPAMTPSKLHDRVTGRVVDGDIVILHDRGVAGSPTVAALPSILSTFEARGYSAVTVSELLGF
jgi:peptidoglycan/xylan/chitin deacetylase (PgdA/CDA1 family)